MVQRGEVHSMKKKKPKRAGGNLGVPVLIRARDEDQKNRWRAAAERARRNLTDWIRCALDDASATK